MKNHTNHQTNVTSLLCELKKFEAGNRESEPVYALPQD